MEGKKWALSPCEVTVMNLPLGQGEDWVGCKGKGGIKTGVSVEEDTLLASPILGQTSKRIIADKKTLLDLTIPRCSKSVELAPGPLSIQLKL
jgi:hypothetical protein